MPASLLLLLLLRMDLVPSLTWLVPSVSCTWPRCPLSADSWFEKWFLYFIHHKWYLYFTPFGALAKAVS